MSVGRGRALQAAALAAVAVGLGLLLRQLDVDVLWASCRAARPWPLALAAAVNLGNVGGKALAWHVLLGPDCRVSPARLLRYALGAAAISALAPMRAGEALRLWWLKERDGVPLARGLGVAAAEKGLDALALFVLLVPLPWLLPNLPSWVMRTLKLGSVLVAAAPWVLWALSRSLPPALAPLVAQAPGRLGAALVCVTGAWLADLSVVSLTLAAVGIKLPLAAGLLVLLTLNLAIAIPSTPAQLGAFELGAVAALSTLGVAEAPALAFALLYHAVQVLPLLAVALIDVRFWGWGRGAGTGTRSTGTRFD